MRCCTCSTNFVVLSYSSNPHNVVLICMKSSFFSQSEPWRKRENNAKTTGRRVKNKLRIVHLGARRGQRLIINRRAPSDKRWRLGLSKTTARGSSCSSRGGIALPEETQKKYNYLSSQQCRLLCDQWIFRRRALRKQSQTVVVLGIAGWDYEDDYSNKVRSLSSTCHATVRSMPRCCLLQPGAPEGALETWTQIRVQVLWGGQQWDAGQALACHARYQNGWANTARGTTDAGPKGGVGATVPGMSSQPAAASEASAELSQV